MKFSFFAKGKEICIFQTSHLSLCLLREETRAEESRGTAAPRVSLPALALSLAHSPVPLSFLSFQLHPLPSSSSSSSSFLLFLLHLHPLIMLFFCYERDAADTSFHLFSPCPSQIRSIFLLACRSLPVLLCPCLLLDFQTRCRDAALVPVSSPFYGPLLPPRLSTLRLRLRLLSPPPACIAALQPQAPPASSISETCFAFLDQFSLSSLFSFSPQFQDQQDVSLSGDSIPAAVLFLVSFKDALPASLCPSASGKSSSSRGERTGVGLSLDRLESCARVSAGCVVVFVDDDVAGCSCCRN